MPFKSQQNNFFWIIQWIVSVVAGWVYFSQFRFGFTVGAFLWIYIVGHFWALQWIFRILASVPLMVLKEKTAQLARYFLLGPLLQIILWIDSQLFLQYKFHLNLFSLKLFFLGKGQVIQFSIWDWIQATFIVVFIFLCHGVLFRFPSFLQKMNWLKSRRFILGCQLLGSFAFVSSHLVHSYADAIFWTELTQPALAPPFAAPLKTPDIYDSFSWFNAKKYSHKDKLFATEDDSLISYPKEKISCQQPLWKPNILFVVVDTLRADAVTKEAMPETLSYLREAQWFFDHHSGSNETRGGIFSLFYSIPPSYFESFRQLKKTPVLMDRLRELDYSFFIYASAPLTMPEFDQTVFSKVPNLRVQSHASSAWQRDVEIVDEFLGALNTKRDPFMGFLFFDAVHGYEYPTSFAEKFTPTKSDINYSELGPTSDPTPERNRYLNSVAYVDSLIGKVFKRLKSEKMLENTVVIFTSDHGQELNDLGLNYWGHNSNFSEFQTRVPFAIWAPPRLDAAFVDGNERTSHYDVAPTLMRWLACSSPGEMYSSGSSLTAHQKKDWLFMGTLSFFAISGKENIVELKPSGDYRILDKRYRETENQVPWDDIYQAWSERWRFFQKAPGHKE